MKIIHTADVHLDTSYAKTDTPRGFGNRRRQSLRDVFHAIIERAKEWPADVVLIAGDLFEHGRVSRDTVAFLRAEFSAINPVPVCIAPGNHDPFVEHSPYATEVWPENVHIFGRPEWTSHKLPNIPLTVHGFAFDGFDISSNPFGTLEVPQDDDAHVAVAHGSERSHQPVGKESYAPFDAKNAAVEGLDYLALGHFHALTPIDGEFATRIHYAGAPEGHNFKETGLHHYLEIEIDPSVDTGERRVIVNPAPVSQTIYSTYEVDVGEYMNTQQIVDVIRKLAEKDGRNHVARVTLTGLCAEAMWSEVSTIADAAGKEFEYLDLLDKTHPADDYGKLAGQSTSLGTFIHRMNKAINDASDERDRTMLVRAREVGLAAYRGHNLAIRGAEGEA